MPTFRYQTLGSSGGQTAAVIDAPDRSTAIRQLRMQGVVPVSVEAISSRQARKLGSEGAAAHSGSVQSVPVQGGLTRAGLTRLIRELATATQAGLPLVPALQTIRKTRTNPRERASIETLLHQVEHGKSLADACASLGKPFNELTISLIRAGEMSGSLSEVLQQAATMLERDAKLQRQVLGSTLYPLFLAVLVGGAIAVIVGYVVPTLMGPLAGRIDPGRIPVPTRIVMFVGNAFAQYWWAGVLGVGAVVGLMMIAYQTPSSRVSIDRMLLKVPVLGNVLSDIAVARFTRTLSTLLASGLPVLTALRITRGTLGNRVLQGVVDDVCEQVSSGKTIAEPMESSGFFPPLLTQVIGLGERTGRLPQTIAQATATFEERVEGSLKTFTAVLPPALILFAALAIGFVMASVLLLLVELQEILG